MADESKAPKTPGYPRISIERAVNGWVMREQPDDYEDRSAWIAGTLNELQANLSERIAYHERALAAGQLKLL